MAYVVSGHDVPVSRALVNGRLYTTWIVQETDVSPSSRYKLTPCPLIGEITLLSNQLAVPGNASSCQPGVGYIAAWVVDTLDEVDMASEAAAQQTIMIPTRYAAVAGELYLGSNVNIATGATGVVRTRITIGEGHP